MVRDTTLDVDRIPAHYPRPWNLQSVLIFSFLTDAQESSSSFNINADYEICTCGEQRQPYLRVYYSLSLWGDQSQPLGIYCNFNHGSILSCSRIKNQQAAWRDDVYNCRTGGLPKYGHGSSVTSRFFCVSLTNGGCLPFYRRVF